MREQKNEIENEERMVTNFIGNFKLVFTEDVIIASWCEAACLFRHLDKMYREGTL